MLILNKVVTKKTRKQKEKHSKTHNFVISKTVMTANQLLQTISQKVSSIVKFPAIFSQFRTVMYKYPPGHQKY